MAPFPLAIPQGVGGSGRRSSCFNLARAMQSQLHSLRDAIAGDLWQSWQGHALGGRVQAAGHLARALESLASCGAELSGQTIAKVVGAAYRSEMNKDEQVLFFES